MPTYPAPVIFLPGIMGCSLRDEYPVDPDTVWSPWKLVIKAYDRITLHPDDTRFELHEPARVVRDQAFGMIYGELIEELRHNLTQQADKPVPVFSFAYDWRKPLAEIEDEFAAFVDEVIGRTCLLRHYHADGYTAERGKVSLVAHSMGGLIVAGYVESRGMARVERVATLATPFQGSLEAVAKTTSGVGALGLSPGSSREREAARVTPSLYHLLPSFAGAVRADPALSDDLFSPQAWQPGIHQTLVEFVRMYGLEPGAAEQRARDLLATMLGRAREHRQRIERLVLEDPKVWLCIVGVNAKTRIRMTSRAENGLPHFELDEPVDAWTSKSVQRRGETGDGTVPLAGAKPRFLPEAQLVCVSTKDFGPFEFRDRLLAEVGFHSSIPSMNLAQRLVISHLLGRPQGKVWGRPAPGVADWEPPIKGLKPG